VDSGFFAKGTTYDASEAGGSSKNCIANVKQVWQALKQLGSTKEGEMSMHSE
jgi:hypothetical protein